MTHSIVIPPKARPGDKIAVLTTSAPVAAIFPRVHEQGLARLAEVTGLEPVEFPHTRDRHPSAAERADDINAAFADPSIRAIIAVVGGDDQITVVPHLDPALALADPKPFVGYSDNTHLHNWLWGLGIASYYGGSTQVQLGSGPGVDAEQAASLRAALIDGGSLELTPVAESEDYGADWGSDEALTSFGKRAPVEPWRWFGPARAVTGPTWGGCVEVWSDILAADRFAGTPDDLAGAILLVEASEELPSPLTVSRILRAAGERGLLEPLAGVLAAQPPVRSLDDPRESLTSTQLAGLRQEFADAVASTVARYNRDAVVSVGVPFGHTRPQWIVPHGGTVTIDGDAKRVFANYEG